MLDEREGHRRGHGRDARPHPRGVATGGDPPRQARLLREAAHAHDPRGAHAGRRLRAKQGRHPDGQPGPRRATTRGDPRAGSRPARSARCSEVHVWTNRPIWPQGIDAARGSQPRARRASTGTSGSARRRERPYHPASTTRSTGAAGGTSAPARSATWPATSWTRRSGPRPARPDRMSRGDHGASPRPRPRRRASNTTSRRAAIGPSSGWSWRDGVTCAPTRPRFLAAGDELPQAERPDVPGWRGVLVAGIYGERPAPLPEEAARRDRQPRPPAEKLCAHRRRSTRSGPRPARATARPDRVSPSTPGRSRRWFSSAISRCAPACASSGMRRPGKVANFEPANDLLHAEYRKGWKL